MLLKLFPIFVSVPTVALAEFAVPWQKTFQDPASPIMEGIINLHHDIMFIICFIVGFVSWMLFRTIYHFHHTRNPMPELIVHGQTIEIIWTLFPTVVLLIIAVPSFALLYSADEMADPALTLKVIGRQWYWTYEYSDYSGVDGESIVFDSYMVPDDEIELGQLRLLEVDNRVVLPINTHIRVLMTASDVIHSWAIPSIGVKCDAMPGRLNQISMFINREGVFYGQCSEICGVNHGFMPIVVEAVKLDEYLEWVSNQMEEM